MRRRQVMALETGSFRSPYPRLNRRALGWLNFLYHKATTPDDWSEDGAPHEWWDQTSTDPMCSFPRFDLQESTYAIGLMADRTPAWREVYARILEEIAERSITYWAAVDWLSQFGPDPKRKQYPEEWKGLLIPEQFWGEYDAPGWVANGIEPWGLEADPIAASGNLFFKGWLNLTQSLHTYVSGEDRWGEPFAVAGVDSARFEWTQHRLAGHLADQWRQTPMGPHCENTKVWPFCLSAAGLGLQMYDGLFGKDTHQVYDSWLEHTKDKYYGVDKSGALEWVAMYYDPLKEHVHPSMPLLGLAIGFYALPQAPEFAEFLYRSAVRFTQWDNPSAPVMPLPDPRMMALGLTMAREMGDSATEARLRAHAEAHFEPRHFGENDSQFGYWFQLGENWPRGQLAALAICAEVGEPGAWSKLFREPNLAKFSEPTVHGVDFPALGISQAWNDPAAGMLQLEVFDGNGSRSGAGTRFRVNRLPDPSQVFIRCDGADFAQWRACGEDEIEVSTDIAAHSFQIFTGYRGQGGQSNGKATIASISAGANGTAVRRAGPPAQGGAQAFGGASRLILPSRTACSCCPAF